jgi:hypothetical protein
MVAISIVAYVRVGAVTQEHSNFHQTTKPGRLIGRTGKKDAERKIANAKVVK